MSERQLLPLFAERARSAHPYTSHLRAEELSGSDKLAKMMIFALKCVKDHPGMTAPQMRDGLLKAGYPTGQALAPQKCMSRLVDAGWVRREGGGRALACYITDRGLRLSERSKNEDSDSEN